MVRRKDASVLECFKLQEKKKGSATYKCKYCSKCLTAGSSSRLKQHLDACSQYIQADDCEVDEKKYTDTLASQLRLLLLALAAPFGSCHYHQCHLSMLI